MLLQSAQAKLSNTHTTNTFANLQLLERHIAVEAATAFTAPPLPPRNSNSGISNLGEKNLPCREVLKVIQVRLRQPCQCRRQFAKEFQKRRLVAGDFDVSSPHHCALAIHQVDQSRRIDPSRKATIHRQHLFVAAQASLPYSVA